MSYFPESKYLERFKKAKEEMDATGALTGDLLLVERVKQPEVKTSSGIILSAETSTRQVNSVAANMPHFVRVLAVGKGYYDDETKEDVPLDANPGDIVLVGEQSVKWLGHWPVVNYSPFEIGITRESEIQIKFKGEEGFDKLFEALNRETPA